MRKFIYTSLWTIPIDRIDAVRFNSENIEIRTKETFYNIRPSYCKNESTKDQYEEIQRQIVEAEK